MPSSTGADGSSGSSTNKVRPSPTSPGRFFLRRLRSTGGLARGTAQAPVGIRLVDRPVPVDVVLSQDARLDPDAPDAGEALEQGLAVGVGGHVAAAQLDAGVRGEVRVQ